MKNKLSLLAFVMVLQCSQLLQAGEESQESLAAKKGCSLQMIPDDVQRHILSFVMPFQDVQPQKNIISHLIANKLLSRSMKFFPKNDIVTIYPIQFFTYRANEEKVKKLINIGVNLDKTTPRSGVSAVDAAIMRARDSRYACADRRRYHAIATILLNAGAQATYELKPLPSDEVMMNERALYSNCW